MCIHTINRQALDWLGACFRLLQAIFVNEREDLIVIGTATALARMVEASASLKGRGTV